MILSQKYLDLIQALDEHYVTHAGNTLPLQLLKVQEELGEASAAYIGWLGLNPRKGKTHDQSDVVMEIADVVLTAVLALKMATGSTLGVQIALQGQAMKTQLRLDKFNEKLSEDPGT